MKNLIALLVSVILAFGAGEAMLRMFTPFPIGTQSHRNIDAKYGYRLDPALGDVDEQGFRNLAGAYHGFQVAAVGDSMTYGNNVESANAWPAVFEAITGERTYNFGIGSYGIYTYHAIVVDALAAGAKGAIVAVYPANDFAIVFSACDIMDARSDFWLAENKRLQLHAVISQSGGHSQCTKARSASLKTKLFENVAILSAYHYAIRDRAKSLYARFFAASDQELSEYYRFPDGCPPVSKRYVDEDARMADLSSPEVAAMLADFERFATDWADRGRGRVGLLVLPTKERVIYEYLRRRDQLATAEPGFIASVETQIALEEKIRQIADRLDLPHRSAAAATADALQEAILAGQRFYPDSDGHPFETGYKAFARTASALWDEMKAAASERRAISCDGVCPSTMLQKDGSDVDQHR
ncbi:hypothetical protein [Sinorhizobium americanum]|uniref:SGNH hydrolase-type esterase domain-containing protein n=1 Tax=Sinorhizobium americanum TaxID=194963 RepID=A0A4R2BV04_9HYPH|nr:hypothetical protein [Sinorhizobium americanum]TCN31436.1 hypothetical protein EV184_106209 [Sinorhizobium americanum]